MNTYASYDLWVVALSYAVSVVGAVISLNVSTYIRAADGRISAGWTLLTAVIFGGCAIWAMHFVGMLAYRPDVPVTYDVALTLVSFLIPVAFAFGGFYTVHRWPHSMVALLIAGAIVGLGVAAMHYAGMAAMRIDAVMTHVGWIVGVSILIAVAASIVALHVFAHWQGIARQLSPFLMGVAVCGMHYTGMAAMRLGPSNTVQPVDYFQGALDRETLTISTAGVISIALLIGLALVTMRQLTDLRSFRTPGRGTVPGGRFIDRPH